MRYFSALFLFIPALALADGYGGAEGKNQFGETISIADGAEMTIYVYKNGDFLESYPLQTECPSVLHVPNRKFSCIPNGKSPLAGATYKVTTSKKWTPCKYNEEYPSDGAYPVYICIKGCNKRTPKIFYERPWEC